jgi:pimeloyl-ACP methyl ester carboxylesterase
VIAPLSKLMDWWAIQMVATMAPGEASNPRLEEALQFLTGPDFIPAGSQPAQMEFNGPVHFRFPTPRPCAFVENNAVHGRLYRCPERWQERPVIILLHGWNDSATYYLRFPWLARRFNRAGFNTAMMMAPFHFRRRPRQLTEFDAGDLLLMAQRTSQAIAEIRALTGWLLNEGCPGVALLGFSMGAGDAGITVCHDARLSAAILASPTVRFRPWLEQRAIWPRIRGRLESARALCERMNETPMNLAAIQPAIPRENILLIEGLHDLICSKDDIDGLCQLWGQPDIWRLPHGHVSICCGGVPSLPGRVLRWMAPRLNKAAVAH